MAYTSTVGLASRGHSSCPQLSQATQILCQLPRTPLRYRYCLSTTFTQLSTWSMCQLSSPRSATLHHRALPLGVRQCHTQDDVQHQQLPSNLFKEKTQCRCFMNLLSLVILSPVTMPRNQRRTLIFFLREGDVDPEILSLMLVPASPDSLSLTAHAQYIYL